MYEPRPGASPADSLDDLDPAAVAEPSPTDTPSVRRWKLRLSDRLGMGTFGVGTLSAYLLWSVVQGFDGLRVTMQEQSRAIQSINMTLERVQDNQRESNNRYLAWESQTGIRFADIDGRLTVLRRDYEDSQRLMRDHDTRLRVLELEGLPPPAAPIRR
jgi:hypothetical protein